MKKLYSILALAAATAVSANAKFHPVTEGDNFQMPVTFAKQTEAIKAFSVKSPLKAPAAQAPQLDEICGNYIWAYLSMQDGEEYTAAVSVSAAEAGKVTIDGFIGDCSIVADYDAAKGTLSVPLQTIGEVFVSQTQSYTCKITHKVLDFDAQTSSDSTEPIVFTLEGNAFSAPETSVMVFGAYDKTDTYAGYFEMSALNILVRDSWEDVGEATFTDEILKPMYGISGNNTDKCTLQQNEEDKNLIRLAGAFAMYGLTSSTLALDITDPDNVLVPYQAIGFQDQTDGSTYVASQSFLTDEGKTPDAKYIITLKDNVITIPGNAVVFRWPDAAGTAQGTDPNSFYLSQNPGVSTIVLPADFNGISDVNIDNAFEGKVEYFNLQGVRVNEPAAGLYIRRAGNKVDKIFVK